MNYFGYNWLYLVITMTLVAATASCDRSSNKSELSGVTTESQSCWVSKIIKVNKVQSWNGKWKFTYTLKAPMDGFSGDYIKNCREYEIDEEDIFDY